MRKYYNFSVKKEVVVKNLTTIEFLEVSPGFSYPVEEHDFYEIVYVDSGELCASFGDREALLEQGEFLLINPHTPHHFYAGTAAPSSFYILCFHSTSTALKILEKKVKLSGEEKLLFSDIVKEAKRAFVFPFDRKRRSLQ